ncbi:hypothetical protein ACGFNU_39910 [Spirillospora sp. NPDC048911]|uniref:hypothetical protein n=1 Tax=Spirillospora sp. NPDC048911 TaxID=3364527 RepID=UPI0037145362
MAKLFCGIDWAEHHHDIAIDTGARGTNVTRRWRNTAVLRWSSDEQKEDPHDSCHGRQDVGSQWQDETLDGRPHLARVLW